MIRSDTRPVGMIPRPIPLANYDFSEKAYHYLTRMVELTNEHDIELVLIKAPNLFPHWFDQWDDQIIAFAEEHDLLYINFLNYTEEIGLDWDIHSFNAGLHLNVFGAELMSRYFGEILQEKFDLPDRRSNQNIAAQWNEMAAQYHNLVELQLSELEKYGNINTFLIK